MSTPRNRSIRSGIRAGALPFALGAALLASCSRAPAPQPPPPAAPAEVPAAPPAPPAPAAPPQALELQPYDAGERAAPAAESGGGRTGVRLLFGFEDGQDGQPINALMRRAENIDIITMLDNGVTEGEKCARVTAAAGAEWSLFHLAGESIADWSDHDYFALDLFMEDDHPYDIVCELYDAASVNYHTRCSFSQTTRPGAQTLLFPINRAKRNGKEGLTWEEARPADKIDLKHLTDVKIFFTPRPDRPAVLWVDNLRLMQEDAAKPKMRVALPANVKAAFDFGSPGAVVPGFQGVSPDARYAPGGYGFVDSDGLSAGGAGWPDLLAGTFVTGERLTFKAAVPNGEYQVWLCAGPILDPDRADPRFRLTVNDRVLCDDAPSFDDYDSEKYLFRFLRTQYSRRPHAVWLDYIRVMYPVHQEKVTVADGTLTVDAQGYFLAGLIVLPASAAADFERMSARIQAVRIEAFEKLLYVPEPPARPAAPAGSPYRLFVPAAADGVGPDTLPPADAKPARLAAAGAPGQNVILRLAVVPDRDLGLCELTLGDLQGPAGVLPASAVQGHFANYRFAGRSIGEMCLLPSLSLNMEANLTQCYWLWLRVPDAAAAGVYKGAFTFRPTHGAPAQVPVEFEVYPFKLAPNLPLAMGMYYGGRGWPTPPEDRRLQVFRDQMLGMRRLGFTSLTVPGGFSVESVDVANRKVKMGFDPVLFKTAREAGLGATPHQPLLSQQLPIARTLARRMPDLGGAAIDHDPGLELRQPEFKALWFDAMRQVKQFVATAGFPCVFEVVDEPREVPNPWNRNLADTMTYARWMQELGLQSFITPMGDVQSGKDYTALADVASVISVHPGEGSRNLQARTRAAGKTLWFYNGGMDRFSWGFYQWRGGARGRFEWHWCAPEGTSQGGYPGREWYNPFTPLTAAAPSAPLAKYPGGFLYTSSLLTAADGITDLTYLYTLARRLSEAKKAGVKPEAVARAERLLADIRARIPEFPHEAAAGAAAARADEWRAQIAEALKGL